MMRVILMFSLAICFLLFSKPDSANARDQQHTRLSPAHFIYKTQQQEIDYLHQNSPEVKKTHIFDKQEDFINVENEEDETEISSRHIAAVNSLIPTPKVIAYLIKQKTLLNSRLLYPISSDRYIMLRSLRIWSSSDELFIG